MSTDKELRNLEESQSLHQGKCLPIHTAYIFSVTAVMTSNPAHILLNFDTVPTKITTDKLSVIADMVRS